MINNPLRKLARSLYWQTLYGQAKEVNINLFENNTNLTDIQVIFLRWLSLYHNIYIDLSTNEEYLNEEIINNDIDLDAYLYFKKNNKNENITNKEKRPLTGIPSVSFISKRRKQCHK